MRNLVAFNPALLAKSGWRLIFSPNSLCEKILKDKYYLSTDFLNAPKGKKSSYLWSSLIRGRNMLTQDVGQKIGSRSLIDVWNHNQIPSSTNFKPFVNKTPNFPNLKVESLINNQSRTQNMIAISNTIHPLDIPKIIQIELSTVDSEDRIIRMHDKNGKFSVKFAYVFYVKLLKAKSPTTFAKGRTPQKLWKFIWSNSFPPRLSIWLWRAIRHKLPSKDKLYHFNIPISPPLCVL